MHTDYTLLMSIVLDGEASAAEENELRGHLRECAECARTWQRWQEIDRRFSAAPMMPAPAGLAGLIMLRLDEANVMRERRRRFALWFGLAWGAALLISGVLAWLAVNWPLELPAAISAAFSGLLGVVELLITLATRAVANLGAPAVAAGAGALLCLTCFLAMAWLWIVNRGMAGQQQASVMA